MRRTPSAVRPRRLPPSRRRPVPLTATRKTLWVAPTSDAAAGAALEAGVDTLLFDDEGAAAACARVGRFRALVQRDDTIEDGDGAPVAITVRVSSPADVDAAARLAVCPPSNGETVLIDPVDGAWAVIPAENLVAAWQGARRAGGAPPPLFIVAGSADAALTAAGALETGVDGVLLRTGDPVDVKKAAAGLAAVGADNTIPLTTATVTAVEAAGIGERVCADLTTLLGPGEGLLVGSFAGGAVLVASERDENSYVPSRPFRVNAGAVHSYVAVPGGRTAYLAELKAGASVLIVGADGASRTGVVGRAKVETRPLVRVDVRADDDGATFSCMLQNAETVKLVAPVDEQAGPSPPPPIPLAAADAAKVAWAIQSNEQEPPRTPPPSPLSSADADAIAWALKSADAPRKPDPPSMPPPLRADADARAAVAWLVDGRSPSFRTLSVADLKPGDTVLLHRAPAGRHTGLHVDERVVEQ